MLQKIKININKMLGILLIGVLIGLSISLLSYDLKKKTCNFSNYIIYNIFI
jgi:uncharacterized membrane protein YczE